MKRRILNVLGTLTMFGGYYVIALLIRWGFGIQADRSIMLVTLFAVAQGRWFQEDKSPVTQPADAGK